MKANELMIGDWVQCTYWLNPHILQVYELKRVGDDELKIVVVEDALPLVFQEVYIKPIPLTAEILEKNGFEEIKWNEFGEESSEGKATNIFRCELETKCLMITVEVGIYKPNFIIISAPDDCGGEVEISNICKIDGSDIMLHELQHALKLCGIDKTIEII